MIFKMRNYVRYYACNLLYGEIILTEAKLKIFCDFVSFACGRARIKLSSSSGSVYRTLIDKMLAFLGLF